MAGGLFPIPGTLNGLDANTIAEALAQQQAEMLAQRTQQATQEASQAGQEYGQLAGAAPPQLSPEQSFLPTLIGNIASVISQNPDFRKRAQENLDMERKALLDARAQNLRQLQDVYGQKAQAAKEAGDLEAHEKALTQREKISSMYDQLLEQQKQNNRKEIAEIEGQTARDVAGIRRKDTAQAEAKEARAEQRRLGSAITSIGAAVRQDPDIKNFVTIRDQFNMGLRGSQSKSNLGDILLMRAIARASDPLSSVREEEFRTFKSAQGALAKYGVNLTRGMWGRGMLTDFGREQMVSQLRQIYASKKQQYDRAYSQYRLSAAAQGVPEELVLRDYTTPEQAEVPGEPVVPERDQYVLMESPDGKSRRQVPLSKVPELIKKGARRVSQ